MVRRKKALTKKELARRIISLFPFKWVVALSVLGFLVLVALYLVMARMLPPVDSLLEYRPELITEVYADDGTLIAEFGAHQLRVVPKEDIPDHVKKVFVASEDHRFYEHDGIDPVGIARAIYSNFKSGHIRGGASTITMQVARTFFLNRELSMNRKIKEAMLAVKIEALLKKDEILYLYLNQVDLGRGCWGIGAAAEYYFGKPASELTLGEAAMLAGMLPAPSRFNPVNNFEIARKKELIVLRKMSSDEVGPKLRITPEQAEAAYNQEIVVHGEKGPGGEAAPYFTEQVRRILVERYGADRIYRDGLKVFTTVNVKADQAAQKAVRKSVMGEGGRDQAVGFRIDRVKHSNPEDVVSMLDAIEKDNLRTWRNHRLQEARAHGDLDKANQEKPDPAPLVKDETYQAIISRVDDQSETLVVLSGHSRGRLDKKAVSWAKKYLRKQKDGTAKTYWAQKLSQVFKPGDRIMVMVTGEDQDDSGLIYRMSLTQEPVIQASLISLSTRTGHVKALIGGLDFRQTQFIRPVQAKRQVGSAMKPIIYAAALDEPKGRYNAATVILDGPVVFEKGMKNRDHPEDPPIWAKYEPKNYGGSFSGWQTLRTAIAKSINTIAVKTAWDIGLAYTAKYAERMGIRSKLDLLPCLPLGCSDITLAELAEAYNVFASEGHVIEPVYITRVYDREGRLLEYEKLLPEEICGDTAGDATEAQALAPAPATLGFTEEDLAADEDIVVPTRQVANHYYYLDTPVAPKDVDEPTWQEYLAQIQDPKRDWLFGLDTPAQGACVTSKENAFVMTDLLKSVVTSGTGARAYKELKMPLAGKTGTTNSYRDAVFAGYSPEILAAVWVGADDYAFSLGKGGTGGGAALPIWIDYMQVVLAKRPKLEFPEPSSIKWVTICLKSGLLATDNCEETVSEPFKKGSEPTISCLCPPPGGGGVEGGGDPLDIDRKDETEAGYRPDSPTPVIP